ncbi:hypothetical protein VPH35_116719 [Triticum aestivum]
MELITTAWSSFPLFIALSLALAASVLFLLHGRHGRPKKGTGKALPPGPPGLLFLARFLALRRSVFHLGPILRDLHARYGPVISVRLSRTLVFVADRRLAHRVLVQGGATFADRPPLSDPGLLFTSGARDISTSPYGAYWRMVRRNLAAEALHPSRVALYAPARRRARDSLVRDLLRARGAGDDVAVRPAFRRAMFELLVYMSLGARLGTETLEEVQELQLRILRSITSFPIFSFFPALTKRLFRRRWNGYVAVGRRQDEIFLPLIRARRERGADGPPCYADSLLALRVAEEGGRPLTDAEAVCLCSEFLNGGTDTTVTSLEWIMAELVNRPDMQSKVYEEVRDKPELDDGDLQSMPYLKAVVLEGLRLHPPGHFLLPHGVQSDGAEVGGHAVPRARRSTSWSPTSGATRRRGRQRRSFDRSGSWTAARGTAWTSRGAGRSR